MSAKALDSPLGVLMNIARPALSARAGRNTACHAFSKSLKNAASIKDTGVETDATK